MSVERYGELLAEYLAASEGPESDAILEQMDCEWRGLPEAERQTLNIMFTASQAMLDRGWRQGWEAGWRAGYEAPGMRLPGLELTPPPAPPYPPLAGRQDDGKED